jgi:hypothetical protein
MLEAEEPLSAFTVHYLLFDVWGRHVRTLALTEVTDVEPGRKSSSGALPRILSRSSGLTRDDGQHLGRTGRRSVVGRNAGLTRARWEGWGRVPGTPSP